jgi:hypothetical protein
MRPGSSRTGTAASPTTGEKAREIARAAPGKVAGANDFELLRAMMIAYPVATGCEEDDAGFPRDGYEVVVCKGESACK